VDYVRRYVIAHHGEDALYRGGLDIRTTLDPRLQLLAQQTVTKQLGGTEPPLEMSIVSVEPPTGFVRAVVGGRDFAASGGQVNLALGKCYRAPPPLTPTDTPTCLDGGGTGRQPGSSFKPFTLATALERGITPDKVYPSPSSIRICPGPADKGCVVRGGPGGSMQLRAATWRSTNTVYVQVIQDAGIKHTAELAHRLGVTTVNPDGTLPSGEPYSALLTLGVAEVAPLDMAAAFGVFAARGMQNPATPIVKIEDVNGKVLEDNSARQPKRVLDEAVADTVTDVTRGVITSGTGKAASIGRPAAGKTGTAEDNADAWFVGFTPTLSTAVWIGYSDSRRSLGQVQGGTIPARAWKDFMSQALQDVPATDFTKPAPIEPIVDALNRLARGGYDPGDKRNPPGTPSGGPYVVAPRKPPVTPPATVAPPAPPPPP
jgi:penicillin-binding protein 1A